MAVEWLAAFFWKGTYIESLWKDSANNLLFIGNPFDSHYFPGAAAAFGHKVLFCTSCTLSTTRISGTESDLQSCSICPAWLLAGQVTWDCGQQDRGLLWNPGPHKTWAPLATGRGRAMPITQLCDLPPTLLVLPPSWQVAAGPAAVDASLAAAATTVCGPFDTIAASTVAATSLANPADEEALRSESRLRYGMNLTSLFYRLGIFILTVYLLDHGYLHSWCSISVLFPELVQHDPTYLFYICGY